jgi:hypothetical protein
MLRRVAVVPLLCAALVLSACEPLGPEELRREVETVGSTAAESSVLADQVADQNAKRTFVRVQARNLADAAQHSSERLTDAHPANGLESDIAEAISLAEAVASAAGELETAPDDAAAAAEAAMRLRDLSQRAKDLAASI